MLGRRVTDLKKNAVISEGLSLSRWSRLKRQTARAPAAVDTASREESVATGAAVACAAVERRAGADSAPAADVELNLPPLSSISLTQDFTPFMQAKVPQALKQQAFKALFKQPHFNVMDGLDIYIDDYTQFEPIAPEVMATLSSWKTIMNPVKQIVTDGGYAVDEASDEGQAALATKTKLADQALNLPDESALVSVMTQPATNAADTPSVDLTVANAHPRHGKRVGEFAYVDTFPLSAENNALAAIPVAVVTSTEKPQ